MSKVDEIPVLSFILEPLRKSGSDTDRGQGSILEALKTDLDPFLYLDLGPNQYHPSNPQSIKPPYSGRLPPHSRLPRQLPQWKLPIHRPRQ
jgi:hypothetical protein